MPIMPPLCDAKLQCSHHAAEIFALILKRMRDKKIKNVNRKSDDVSRLNPHLSRMTITVKLYSDTTTARRDLTGEPCQVYENPVSSANWIINQVQAGNAVSIFRVDGNCNWLHVVCPQVVKDIYGNPELIVGNCTDVLGEFSLIKVNVSKLR